MTSPLVLEKSPLERAAYSFNFNDFLSETADTISTWSVGADDGVALEAEIEANGIVAVQISGGDNLRSYLIAADITTAGGLVERQELLLRVRGRPVSGAVITGSALVSVISGSVYIDGQRVMVDNDYLVLA